MKRAYILVLSVLLLMSFSGCAKNESRGVDTDAMREILATYNVGEDEIYVIPWHHPLSSYLGSWQIVTEGEDTNAKRQDYIDHVKNMLFEAEEAK